MSVILTHVMRMGLKIVQIKLMDVLVHAKKVTMEQIAKMVGILSYL